MSHEIKWLDEPEQHDYTAALSFLSLIYPLKKACELVHALRVAPVENWKAKDIARRVRESGDVLYDEKNSHVEHDLEKIDDGKKLSPILMVRTKDGKLLIVDGFHRVCAVHLHSEDHLIFGKCVGDEA